MTDTKQTSIQMDDEWRDAIDDIADAIGIRKGRHTTQVLRLCTMTYLEQTKRREKGLQEPLEKPASNRS